MATDSGRVGGAETGSHASTEPASRLGPTGFDPARCRNCDGGEWVCENHRDCPWDGTSGRDDACGCGAGAPCGACNLGMAAASYSEPWRELAYRAIGLVGDAIKDTNWGQPTFGDDYEDELRAAASAIEAATAGETQSGSTEGESAVGDSRDAQPEGDRHGIIG